MQPLIWTSGSQLEGFSIFIFNNDFFHKRSEVASRWTTEKKWRNQVYFVQSKGSLKIRWISWCLQCCEKHRCCEKKRSSKHENIDEQWKTSMVTCPLWKKTIKSRNCHTFRRFCRTKTQSTFRSFRLTLSRGPQTVPVRIPRPSPRATSSPSVFLAVVFCFVSFFGRRVFLCGVYFELVLSGLGFVSDEMSAYFDAICVVFELCSLSMVWAATGKPFSKEIVWQTCFLVKVGKRLALCTWLCGSSYSTAIKASQKIQHSKQKRVRPYRI